ncbi:hypothetical protein LPJ70_002413, partial [Coemansia sp. RSA 2708]
WFNRNRALAWFTNPQVAAEALEDLKTCELVHVKPYQFSAADMKYFNPDNKLSEMAAGGLARRRTISGGSGLARRNTVSGASHYHRGHLYASATNGTSVPPVPQVLGAANGVAGAPPPPGSTAPSPMMPPRRLRRFSRSEH